jgi:hypothetical protein
MTTLCLLFPSGGDSRPKKNDELHCWMPALILDLLFYARFGLSAPQNYELSFFSLSGKNVFPRKEKNSENSLRLGKRVAHANKNFGSVYLARHTNYSKLVYLRVTHLTFSFH